MSEPTPQDVLIDMLIDDLDHADLMVLWGGRLQPGGAPCADPPTLSRLAALARRGRAADPVGRLTAYRAAARRWYWRSNMLTPEQIAALPEKWQALARGLAADEYFAISPKSVRRILATLAAGYAPRGFVLVDEAGLRLLAETACRNCRECQYSREHDYGEQATCDGDLTRGQCRAALLAHFNLAPERDATDGN